MTGHQLGKHRKERKRTQEQTARALNISQTYLSLLETGKRPLTDGLRKKAVRFFGLPATEYPTAFTMDELPIISDKELVADLADLGYPGFSHLMRSRRRKKNPADILLSALKAPKREPRIVEALPWLLLRFPDMGKDRFFKLAKMHDLQNRSGYIASLARRLAENDGDSYASEKLREIEDHLRPSLLAREDTLCNETMTLTERKWLEQNRPDEARIWHVLTDLSPEHLNHG